MSKVNQKGSKFNQISKAEYAKLIFKNPCPSSSSEYLTLRLCSKDLKGTKQIVICEQNYQIDDDMKVSQLKTKWFESNKKMNNFTLQTTIISSKNTKNLNKDNFIFTWNGKFQILNNQCILTLKQKVGINRFFGNDLIKIYAQHDLPLKKDQLAFNYKIYEGKYLKKLDLGLKIINLPQDKVHYFYLEFQIDAKIQEIYKKSNMYFITEDLIKYQPEDGFSLLLLIQNVEELHKRLNSLQEKYQCTPILNDNYFQIDLSEFKQRKIRQVCYPGEIIQIKLNQPQKVKFGEHIKTFDDVEIVIQCNRNISSPQSVSQSLSLISTPIIEKRQIKKQFSDMKRMKVSTLLKQNNIEECMSTSLCHRQLIIRPFQHIDKLAQIISKDDKQLHLSLIPQNFLYYKQLTHKSIQKQRSSIDEVATRLTESNIIENQDYELIRSTRNRRVEQIKDQDLKQHDLIEPIVTYTSPWLFERFNSYLRQTSVSQLTSEQIQQKWQYSFCRTLLQSLLKLKNYQGVVYRGSSKFNYNYKIGQIIEWNAFSSTSKDIHIVLEYFLKQQHDANSNQLYIFQIQTFSGKQISEFSFFAIENQVLILPYTRFKVKDITTETHCDGFQYQHVKMIQIPIPKKVNDSILVNVDIQHQTQHKQNCSRNRQYRENSQVSKSISYLSSQKYQFIKLTSLLHFKEWLIEYKEILVIKNCKLIFLINLENLQQVQPDLGDYMTVIQIVKHISTHSLVILYGKNIEKHHLNLTGISNCKNVVFISNLRQLEKLFSWEFDLNGYLNSSNLEQLEQVVYCEKCQIV